MSAHQPVHRHRREHDRAANAVATEPDAGPGDRPGEDASLADVIERMFAIFDKQLSLATIILVVRRCRRELDILASPLPAATLESMARQRLAHLSEYVAARTPLPTRVAQ